ncbi:MAG: hypothetical protein HQ518_07525 [Rhodopirellula sp.]|nr:hypothetical protein [Rhodopirellula sp.]
MFDSQWSIQHATDSQLPLIQRWLPQAFVGVPRPTVFAAVDPNGKQLCGAATLRQFGSDARFLLFVEPGSRRQTCGTLLFSACQHAARESGAERLLAGQSLLDTNSDVAFFTAQGLRPCQRRTRFELELSRAAEILDPVCRRIERTNRWPHACRIISPSELPVRTVAEFAAAELGGFVDSFSARLRRGDYSNPTSIAVVSEGRLVGLMLAREERPLEIVDVIAVVPEFRLGAVATVMKYRHVQAALATGCSLVSFEADEILNPDTVRFARRCDAEEFETRVLFGMPCG